MTSLEAFAILLKPTILRVWDQIGSDVMALGQIDNQSAIEMCVDSDRLRTYGGDDGAAHDALIEAANVEHGWDDVIFALTESIDLI